MLMTTALNTGTNELLCELDGHVATITLNRPEQRNALSDSLTPALRQTLLELDADPRVRCIVITGAGTAFCAGGDVSGMGGNRGSDSVSKAESDALAADTTALAKPTLEDAIHGLKVKQETLTLRLHECSKPTIAALPGPAAGAGLSIALACDLRIAADSAFVTTAFRNIGLSGDYGCSWFMTQLIGTARTRELFYSARRVGAEEALSVAIRFMKENLNRAQTADLRTCLGMEADRMVRCTQTQDHREAVAAFLEKRPPTFSGR
jgi:enoyl-CoA hydratase/carnithine racemase